MENNRHRLPGAQNVCTIWQLTSGQLCELFTRHCRPASIIKRPNHLLQKKKQKLSVATGFYTSAAERFHPQLDINTRICAHFELLKREKVHLDIDRNWLTKNLAVLLPIRIVPISVFSLGYEAQNVPIPSSATTSSHLGSGQKIYTLRFVFFPLKEWHNELETISRWARVLDALTQISSFVLFSFNPFTHIYNNYICLSLILFHYISLIIRIRHFLVFKSITQVAAIGTTLLVLLPQHATAIIFLLYLSKP